MQNRFQNAFMIANPHYYDYIHTLEFSNGTVEFVDGAGQVLNAVVMGRYRVFGEDETSARIDFFNLVETNPYSRKHEKIRDIAPIQVKVVREEGLFPFPKNVMLKIEKKGRHPCLLYRERYVFDKDPRHG
jgi:hypothetical protein